MRHKRAGSLRQLRGPSSRMQTGSPRLLSYEPGAFHALPLKASLESPEVGPLSSERLGNWPKDTHLVSGWAEVPTQILWAPKLVFALLLTLRCTVFGQEKRGRSLALTLRENNVKNDDPYR